MPEIRKEDVINKLKNITGIMVNDNILNIVGTDKWNDLLDNAAADKEVRDITKKDIQNVEEYLRELIKSVG